MHTETQRLFIALPLWQSLPQSENMVESWQRALRRKPIHWSPRDKWHLTLQFLGATPVKRLDKIIDALTETVPQHPQQQLALSGLGCFPVDKPHALAIYVQPDPALMDLQQAVQTAMQRCGIEPERRHYIPHITVAKSKPYLLAGVQQQVSPLIETAVVDEVVLFKSEPAHAGGRYARLQSFPLKRTRQSG